jgi:hypothetical protein
MFSFLCTPMFNVFFKFQYPNLSTILNTWSYKDEIMHYYGLNWSTYYALSWNKAFKPTKQVWNNTYQW